MWQWSSLLEKVPLRGQTLRLGGTLVAIGLLGLVLLVVARLVAGGAPSPQSSLFPDATLPLAADVGGTVGVGSGTKAENATGIDPVPAAEAGLEAKWSAALSRIRGAGQVSVVITLSASNRLRFAQDSQTSREEQQQKATDGVLQTTTQETSHDQPVLTQSTSGQSPILTQSTRAQVEGVLVVAEGAGDASVRATITRAVEVGLGVPMDRIVVVTGKGSGS